MRQDIQIHKWSDPGYGLKNQGDMWINGLYTNPALTSLVHLYACLFYDRFVATKYPLGVNCDKISRSIGIEGYKVTEIMKEFYKQGVN